MAFLARDVERYRVVVRFNTDLNFIEYIFNTERYENFYRPSASHLQGSGNVLASLRLIVLRPVVPPTYSGYHRHLFLELILSGFSQTDIFSPLLGVATPQTLPKGANR